MPGPMTAAALVRAVSPRLAAAELTYLRRRSVDLGRARMQHAAYLDLLRGEGLEIVHAPPVPEHPDGVFVEDAVVVVSHLAILARSGAVSRRGEVEDLAPVLAARGLAVTAITNPATLDGGDVLQVDDTLYVGRTARTNDAAAEQLRVLVAPLGRTVIPVEVTGVLHLKTAATALPDGRILAHLDHVSATAFRDREVVAVAEPAGANVLLVGDTIVLSASAPRTAAMLRRRGYRVREVDISELEKVEAGPTCPSVLLPPARAPHPIPGLGAGGGPTGP
jgi:dimethylargininase